VNAATAARRSATARRYFPSRQSIAGQGARRCACAVRGLRVAHGTSFASWVLAMCESRNRRGRGSRPLWTG